jgi:hypothetical protein
MFSAPKETGELQCGGEQNQRDGKMHNQRMKAAEELIQFAPLDAVGWSFQQKNGKGDCQKEANSAQD